MPSTVRRAATLVLLTTLGLTACGDDGGGASSGPVEGDEVELVNLDFVPETLKVEPGTTVTWRWTERIAHDVVANEDAEGEFESEVQSEGTFEHTFDEPGEYPYECTLHPGMKGTIIVE